MHLSQFAGDLVCQHCWKHHTAKEWPTNGDYVPFFYQTEPGNFNLELTCPNCGKIWYVVWDSNPEPIMPLSF